MGGEKSCYIDAIIITFLHYIEIRWKVHLDVEIYALNHQTRSNCATMQFIEAHKKI